MQDQTQVADPTEVFQKIWKDSLSSLVQAVFALSPDSLPAESMTQLRKGLFQALSESWEEFRRSPEFLSSMRQWTDGSAALPAGQIQTQFHCRLDTLSAKLGELAELLPRPARRGTTTTQLLEPIRARPHRAARFDAGARQR